MKNYWRILAGHPRPYRFLAARVLMATGICRYLTIPQKGFSIRFHPANLSSQLWIDPRGRELALSFFRDYLKPGDLVVDVGANIGDTVLVASRQAGPNGHVVGIEPHPRTFKFLNENIALNQVSNVTTINAAAGTRSGYVSFSNDRRDDMNRVGDGPLQVQVARLDDLVRDRAPIALLKVDVEGYEKFVFDGGRDVLARSACVYFEVSSLHFSRFGYTTRDLLTLLDAAGFTLFREAGARRLARIALDYDTEHFQNLLALRDIADFERRTGWTLN